MLGHYHVVTAAHRVVWVGSVGTRAYLVLLLGNGDDDPLFLQVKESVMAAQARYLPRLGKEFMYNGKRGKERCKPLRTHAGLYLGQRSRLLCAADEKSQSIDSC